jgi:hypothetical protein
MHEVRRKSSLAVVVLFILVAAGVAAVAPPKGDYKNLQILPKDIPAAKLDSIMESYNKALAVGCNFCHAPMKGFADSLDYASDSIHMKADARKMMKMTIELNKTWFNYNNDPQPVYLNVVQCMTCHRGDPYPVLK